mmetsp:Transcript_7475/g.20800  ORF Transcript_7475/g.20800 Transcript_7475/m.20800 type:complete len:706 (+) Transcript_7475:5698-7815(+)
MWLISSSHHRQPDPTIINATAHSATSNMSPSTGSSGRYEHHEAITISPLAQAAVGRPPATGSTKKLHLDVKLEATSTVTFLPHADSTGSTSTTSNAGLPPTPFPSHVVELVKSHGLKRLLVQVGSSSSSSASAPTADTSAAATGPIGTSITAELYTTAENGDTSIDDRAQSLLRSLVGSRLICAPLDSISIAKNQHYSYPLQQHRRGGNHQDNNATATYQIVLPASAGHFCAEGLASFRRNLLPCRDHAGLLASAPSSDMLLGTSTTPAASSQIGLTRRGLWIDVSVSSARKEDDEEGNCFSSDTVPRGDSDGARCTVSLQQGSTYGVELDAIIESSSSTPEQYYYSSSFSLGDVLGDPSSTLTHCPLADSSEIITILSPTVQRASFARPYRGVVIDADEDNDEEERGQRRYEYDLAVNNFADDLVVHDVQTIIGRDGAISLSEKWTALELQGSATPDGIGSNLLRVDRTVDKPRGVTNGGMFHSVYRNGASIDEEGVDIVVKTMDTYPKFVTPLLQSLKIRLYEGNGAGNFDFVPSLGSTFVEIQGFDLLPQNDGSLSLAVTKLLPPDSSLWISLEYKPRFLSFEHFPSDPNRGVDLLPSSGVFFLPNTGVSDGVRLYSPSVIIMPPVPDMSMPFNVISLACTLYAFIVGSLVNFLVRKSSQSISDAYKGRKPRNKVSKLKEKLRKKLQFLRRRKSHIDSCRSN